MEPVKKIQKRNTLYQTAVTYYEKSEIRCPDCGKLIVKGSFAPGSYLDMRCPNNGCRYHKEPLVIMFQADETTKHNNVHITQQPIEAQEARTAGKIPAESEPDYGNRSNPSAQ